MSTSRSASTETSVLVLDHVRLGRENLVATLDRDADIVGAVGAGEVDEAVGRLREHRFTVVLMSIFTAERAASCREIVRGAAPTPVIAYAVPCCDDAVFRCAEAGVAGYLLDDDPLDDLIEAIAAAARGDVWCPARVAAMLMRQMGPGGRSSRVSTSTGRLTTREREIVDLIDEGLSNKDIARKLSIEVRTVKNHVHNLLEKLQVHRRGEAAALVRGRSPASLN
jgi:DNA-binding NarL/FixJ family response regulator